VARYVGAHFTPRSVPSEGAFTAPPGGFSTLVQNPDGSFTRTLKNGTAIEFDAAGLQTAVVDRNGNATRYLYDAQGQLAKIVDPTNALADPSCATQGVTCLAYSGGKLAGVTDPANRTTLFQVDAKGDLIKITDPDASFRSFAYDARHRLNSQTSKRNFQTTYDYNFAGRNIQANLPDLATRQVAPSETVALVDPASGFGTAANPAPYVRPAEVVGTFTDGNGNVTTYRLDGFGAATEIVDSLTPPRTTTILRNINGDSESTTAPNGAVTERDYDALGNLIALREAVGDPLQRETTFEYEPVFNQITRIVNPEQQLDPQLGDTRFEYDANGNLIKIINAELTETVLAYADPNCPGLVTGVTAAFGLPEEATTTFGYDPVTCNLLTVTDPLLNPTDFAYDAVGDVTKVTDSKLHETRFIYDPLNRVTKQIDATNLDPNPACGTAGVTCFAYDASGNLGTLTDANGNATDFGYDSRERLATRTDPLLNDETFQYDGQGNLRFVTDRKNQTIEFQYDAVNRLSLKVMLPGTVDETSRSFGYDVSDNLLSILDADSTLAMTYDLLNRLKTVSTTGAPAQPDVLLTYGYDRNNNRKTMDDGLFGLTSYDYDALNRLDLLTNPSAQVADFGYDPLGRRNSVTLPNGASTSLDYDLAGRLTGLVNAVNAATLSSFAYSHDAVGNRETLTQTRTALAVASPLSYLYDDLSQTKDATHPLPAGPAESFTYDPVGNRLGRDGQATNNVIGVGNRLLEDEQFCYGYDLNGNLETKTVKVAAACTGGVTNFTFDPENRLVRIDFPGGGFAAYRYDGLGRRIEKDVDGQITRYLYDAEDILFEFDGTNTLLARYTHGPGIDDPLVVERDGNTNGLLEASEAFVYHRDGLGSVVQLTDATGAVARAYAYDAYGRIAAETGVLENPYAFTGRELDGERVKS
jgi:YD repeat-containing protein